MRRLLARRSAASEVTEAEAVDTLEQAIETALADKTGFLSRTVAAVEVQLSAEAAFAEISRSGTFARWRVSSAAPAGIQGSSGSAQSVEATEREFGPERP